MDKDTSLQGNSNVSGPQNLEEIIGPLKLALKVSGGGIRELEKYWVEAKVGWDSILASIRHYDPSFQPDSDYSPALIDGKKILENVSSELPPAIIRAQKTRMVSLSEPRQKTGITAIVGSTKKGKKSGKITHKERALEFLDSKEMTPKELCSKLDIDYENFRSYIPTIYKETGLVGRRKQRVGLTYTYRYATKRWYQERGIAYGSPGGEDVEWKEVEP